MSTGDPFERSDPAAALPPVALSIAGSDSGGGAGIQADLRTFHRFGVYGTTAVTLVTAQSSVGVEEVHLLPPELVARQIDVVAGDFELRAAKTGALGSAAIVEAVAAAVERNAIRNLVVDPVMVSKHGDPLLPDDGAQRLAKRLLPKAALVTPNLPEAAALTGRPVEDEAGMGEAARALHDAGAAAVLVTGGHLAGEEVVDVLYDGRKLWRFPARRLDTRHTHGTGCTYSAAITALLARGEPLPEAVRAARAFVSRAIATAPGLGHGHGPLNHWS